MAEGKGNLLAYVALTLALSVIIAQTIALIFYSEENSRIKAIEREAGDLAEKNRALMEQNSGLMEELGKLRARIESTDSSLPKKAPEGEGPKSNGGTDDSKPPENEKWK